MSLKQWADNGWLRPEAASNREIRNLFVIVDRDLMDSRETLSTDWQFGIAYNAALKLCTILLRSESYRPSHGNHHYRTIMAVPEILGPEWTESADYLNGCRMKRNTLEYDYAGVVTENDVQELMEFLARFEKVVQKWLEQHHPDLI